MSRYLMRKLGICVTACCFVTTQTSALAQPDPHAQGVAAGQAANTAARGSVSTPSASTVVPGLTTSPPESRYYRQPNLAAQGDARLSLCATTPDDPVCQAQLGAMASANTPRPAVTSADPAVAAANDIIRSPSSVLEDLAAYYAGCTTSTTTVPAGTQARTCVRYEGGASNYTCSRTLSVDVSRATNCVPGDWIAHAASGDTGLDAQCTPDRPPTAQHFRVTQGGSPLAFFDVDMTTPAVFPRMVATLGTTYSTSGQANDTGVWVADQSCSENTCTLTAMVAAERSETCTGNSDAGLVCTSVDAFLERYAACPAGTQSGDNIQVTTCLGDGGCNTTALDGTLCYAPAGVATPYVGTDVTGAVPGFYWNIDSNRAVVGWAVNPAYGPIPTMQLTYTRATTTDTTTDRWDDQCPSTAPDARCTVGSASICVDGPSTKVIDGVPVTRDCWQYQNAMTCDGGSGANQCAWLLAQGCAPSGSVCRQTDPTTGACDVFEDTYSCPVPAHTVTAASNCPSNVFCFQGSCFDISRTNDADFGRSMSMLEAAREAGVYLDTDRMQMFRGEDNRCRDRLLKNCCYSDGAGAGMTNQSLFGTGSRLVYDILMNSENRQFVYQGMSALLLGGGFSGTFTSYGVTVAVNGAALPAGSVAVYSGDSLVVAFDPWSLVIAVIIYIIMSLMSCNEDEGKLAMKEGAKLCHTIGTYCSSCIRILGSCVSCIEETTSKCCFNSMLARIVNEQGRSQIAKGWGGAENPDCSGFTVAQLQSLDFSRMDLSEFYASLVPTLANIGNLQNSNASRVPTCYYGQGKC